MAGRPPPRILVACQRVLARRSAGSPRRIRGRTMRDGRDRFQSGIGDLLLVVTVAAVVMGLGAVAAGLTRLDPGPRRVLIPSVSIQRSTAVSATALTDYPYPPASGVAPRATGAERPVVASPWPSAQSRAVAPGDPSRLDSAGDDSRAFLAHMTAVLHRRGLPLPGAAGRQRSLIVHETPVTTTSGTHQRVVPTHPLSLP